MNDAALALQKAVYDHLVADAGVRAAFGDPPRLYDVGPKRPVFPYAVFDDWRVSPIAGAPESFIHEFRLRVHARHEGRLAARAGLAAFYDALQDASLTPDGHVLVSLRFVFSDVFPRPDGASWGGATRFRAVTRAAT